MPQSDQSLDTAPLENGNAEPYARGLTPEADRLFAPPAADKATYLLRELAWGEHFVATEMAFARGPVVSYLFCLGDADAFFNDSRSVGATMRSRGSYKALNIEKFIAWIRNVIGDDELAQALDDMMAAKGVYNDQIADLSFLISMRTAQCESYRRRGEQAVP